MSDILWQYHPMILVIIGWVAGILTMFVLGKWGD
jgi:hypothetical protein